MSLKYELKDVTIVQVGYYYLLRVYSGSRIQRARLLRAPGYNEQISLHQFHFFARKEHLWLTSMFYIQQVLLTTIRFLGIKLLVVNRTQCIMFRSETTLVPTLVGDRGVTNNSGTSLHSISSVTMMTRLWRRYLFGSKSLTAVLKISVTTSSLFCLLLDT